MTPGFAESTSGKDLKRGMLYGNFVYFEDTKLLLFQDVYTRLLTLNRVNFLTSEWNVQEGYKNLPKPTVIDASGNMKEIGDQVLYAYLNDRDDEVVIFGSINHVQLGHYDPYLATDPTDTTDIAKKSLGRNNDQRYFLVHDDAAGNIILYLEGKNENGNLKVKIVGNDNQKNGNITLELNGKFTVNQVDDDNKPINSILLDNTSGAEQIVITDKNQNIIQTNKTGMVLNTQNIRVGTSSETLKKILVDLITAIEQASWTTPSGTTVFPPINDSAFQNIVSRLNNFMDGQ